MWPSARAPRGSGSRVGGQPTAHELAFTCGCGTAHGAWSLTPQGADAACSRVLAVAPGWAWQPSPEEWGGPGSAVQAWAGRHPRGPSTRHAVTAAPVPSSRSELGPRARPGPCAVPDPGAVHRADADPVPGRAPSPCVWPERPCTEHGLAAGGWARGRGGPGPRASLVLPVARTPVSLCGRIVRLRGQPCSPRVLHLRPCPRRLLPPPHSLRRPPPRGPACGRGARTAPGPSGL